MWKPGRDGPQEVLTWSPRVSERLVVIGDDGKTAGRWYTVRVGADEMSVAHADFASGDAWERFPDAVGTGVKTTRDALFNAIQAEAAKLERASVVTHTGWHVSPDGDVAYVRADGRTDPTDAPVRIVGMPSRLAEAARPPLGVASDDEIRHALVTIRERGAPLVRGLGMGARSLGYTIRRVGAGWLLIGDPASGKTGTVAIGRGLTISTPTWPPVLSATFADTITQIERHVAREADMLAALDDAALTGDSTDAEIKVVVLAIDRVFRAAYNGGPMRERAAKGPSGGLIDAPSNPVRGGVAGTLQQVPPTMQSSLYRRVALVSMEPGQVDVGWLREHGGELDVPFRTLGDRIIERLRAPDAAELLEALDGEACHLLGEHLGKGAPSGELAELPRLHAFDLAGVLLASDAAGLDRGELVPQVLERIREDLVAQTRRAGNRKAATEDLAAAVGEIVRHALHSRRAHVRTREGTLILCVPGQTDTAHGYRERLERDGVKEYEAAGPALYWLEAHAAIGGADGLAVRSRELHMLLSASRDPRVRGIPADHEALAVELGATGALVPSTQKRKGSPMIRVEGFPARRLIVLRPELIFDLPEPEGDGATDSESPGGGATGATAATSQVNATLAAEPPISPAQPLSSTVAAVAPVAPPKSPLTLPGEPAGPVPRWRCGKCGYEVDSSSDMDGLRHPGGRGGQPLCGGRFRPDAGSGGSGPMSQPEPPSETPAEPLTSESPTLAQVAQVAQVPESSPIEAGPLSGALLAYWDAEEASPDA